MTKKQKIFLILSAILGIIIVAITCLISVFKVDEKIEKLAMIHGTNINSSLGDQSTQGNSEAYINNQLLEVALLKNGFGYFVPESNSDLVPMQYSEYTIKKLFYKIEGVEEVEEAEDPGKMPTLGTKVIEENDGETYVFAYVWNDTEGRMDTWSKKHKIEKGVKDAESKATQAAMEEIADSYESAKEIWKIRQDEYYNWKEYKRKLDQWTNNGKNFEPQYPDGTIDSYTNFWIRIAEKTLGTSFASEEGSFADNGNKMAFKEMLEKIADTTGGEKILSSYMAGEDFSEEVGNIIETAKEQAGQGSGNGSSEGGSGGSGSSGGSSEGGNGGSGSSGGSSEGGNGGSGNSGGSSEGGNGGSGNSGGSSEGGNGGSGNSGGNTEEKPEDKVAPVIKSVSITSPTSGTYREGQEVKITVTFDKNIYGTERKVIINKNTAPKLYIRFGDTGENKLTTFDSAKGPSIIYSYKINKADNGVLQIGKDNNYVGTIYSETGVKAELKTISGLSKEVEIIADNIGPKVEKIEAISKAGEYKTGSDIEIKVTFNEKVYATKEGMVLLKATVPVLNISFGEGEVRNPSIKTINNVENYLIYKYTITSEDRGTLKVNGIKAFDGTKTVYDKAGNGVNLMVGQDLTGNVITVNSELTQITIDKKDLTLDLNGTKTSQIIATVKPEGTKLTWESSDSKVAKVDSNTGKVTALAIGETTITVKAADGTKATCKVTVKDTTKGITKVQLNKEKLELDLNGTKTENLTATVTPEQLEVTWSSTNEKVATVDKATGKVTAIAKGEATIIAKAKDGTTANCKITVVNSGKEETKSDEIDLNIKNTQVVLGKTETIQLKPITSDKNEKVTYESSDENIATVDENGKVTIKTAGSVSITAKTEDGKTANSIIEVVEVTEGSELSNKKISDINDDGNIDITDLLIVLRHIAASSSSQIAEKHQDWIITGEKFILADVNANGVIDITDSLKIQRHIAASKNENIKSNHPDWMIETNWKSK